MSPTLPLEHLESILLNQLLIRSILDLAKQDLPTINQTILDQCLNMTGGSIVATIQAYREGSSDDATQAMIERCRLALQKENPNV